MHIEPVWITSGLRIGTPAITTRGMKDAQAEQIVYLIDEALTHRDDEQKIKTIKEEVKKLCAQFPIYQ